MNIIDRLKKYVGLTTYVPENSTIPAQDKASKTLSELDKNTRYVYRRELEMLQASRQQAVDDRYPNRVELQLLYNDIVDNDAHLKAILRKRILNVSNKKYKIVDAEGNELEDLTMQFKKRWFRDFVTESMESLFYGYSLIGIDGNSFDNASIVVIPRENIIPEFSVIMKDYTNTTGNYIKYNEKPLTDFFVFVCNDTLDLGILNTAAPLCILKRHSFANWDEFEEIFGIPMRIARTHATDPRSLSMIESWLKKMGTAAYAIFPPNTDLEIKESGSRDAFNVFDKKIDRVNLELSKLVLGQTMTTDSGSSRSQSETHSDVEEQIIKDDCTFIEFVINDNLRPILQKRLGFPENAYFTWDTERDLTASERIAEIDGILLSNGIKLSNDYLTRMYNVEIDTTQTAANNVVMSASPLIRAVMVAYKKAGFNETKYTAKATISEENLSELINNIYQNQSYNLVPESLINDITNDYYTPIESAINEGYGDVLEEDEAFIQGMKDNARSFSSAKAKANVVEISNLLYNKDGELYSFEEFSKLARLLTKDFTGAYQAAEESAAMASAQMARRWKDAQREGIKYVQYRTVGDARVRPEHKKLNKLQRQVSDPIWSKLFPPNGWGCRCTVALKSEGKANDLPEDFDIDAEVPKFFQHNSGMTGEVFNSSHPYFSYSNLL